MTNRVKQGIVTPLLIHLICMVSLHFIIKYWYSLPSTADAKESHKRLNILNIFTSIPGRTRWDRSDNCGQSAAFSTTLLCVWEAKLITWKAYKNLFNLPNTFKIFNCWDTKKPFSDNCLILFQLFWTVSLILSEGHKLPKSFVDKFEFEFEFFQLDNNFMLLSVL